MYMPKCLNLFTMQKFFSPMKARYKIFSIGFY